MKSIGTRLALWYAAAATTTLVCVCIAGFYLLRYHLVHGLDQLNRAQFAEISAHLGDDYTTLNAHQIDARIRETTDYASVLFFITIDDPQGSVRPIFYSTNLHGQSIPDVPGKRVYNTFLPGVGEVRTAEFILKPFDVTVATPLSTVREATRQYSQICLWLIGFVIIVSGAIGLGLSRLALRPVRLISETAAHISSDNLSERIPVGGVRDEISDLSRLLNKMFDRLEASFKQVRRFTAEASHELKTPLSLIRLQAERLLINGNLTPENAESVHQQMEELSRLNQIVEELLFLSRADARDIKLNLTPHDPASVVANFAQDARVLAEHCGVRFEYSHFGVGEVLIESRWLRRVLLNVLTNALRACRPSGKVTLRSTIRDNVWRVEFEDEGPGVALEYRERIFDRFFRLSPGDDEGTGLGLAICRGVVTLHQGEIWADAATNSSGLLVIFTIPARSASHTAEERANNEAVTHAVSWR